MAVSFSDLHTESGLNSLNNFLSGKTYISGDQLTKDDVKVYAAVVEKPGDAFPNASRWYANVASQLASSFPGKAVGVNIAAQSPAAEVVLVEEATKEQAGDDDLGLFEDETEEEHFCFLVSVVQYNSFFNTPYLCMLICGFASNNGRDSVPLGSPQAQKLLCWI